MRPSTGPAARTHNSRIARQQAVAARMAPQDASPMRLYSAMADVAPFLFIVFNMANSSRSFSSMAHESSASVHPRRPFQSFVSFRRTDLLQSKAFGVARP